MIPIKKYGLDSTNSGLFFYDEPGNSVERREAERRFAAEESGREADKLEYEARIGNIQVQGLHFYWDIPDYIIISENIIRTDIGIRYV